ncbi:diacylglycerol kinase family enzyme [Limimaricola variabilis]|uniref:Diacylglycerol kinase family enzyme n=1 Tax=Limimaricola variabilis TaxID=1492771 RepID=A0ABR6HLS3_9RHOB|nr:diacylglycerol kinase family protein [Limimaricola variabilis]MBB3711314.1 diacylglycerol kinase family enzyme [Limimaricola variabilis]WPY93707.1 diacylglycerol kinase family protein [Limimaricola variabilis]
MSEPIIARPVPDRAGIRVICNDRSGRNSREAEAIEQAMRVLGPDAELRHVKGRDIDTAARQAVRDGCDVVVAAGGDGTIMAVASALNGSGCALGVLPLGTFNFFARGYGIPEDPEAAAQVIAAGHRRPIDLGAVNGRLFLNNASIGVYPAILKERETVYRRWGRRRIAAHWSVLKTFWRFRRPLKVEIEVDGERRKFRTPLVFAARSAFQLEHFGLQGVDCIRNGGFSIFVAPDEGRMGLLSDAVRLAVRQMRLGEDFELICADRLTIHVKRQRQLVACDGEKFVMEAPLEFEMIRGAFEVIVPETANETAA